VDANVLFAALIRKGRTKELLFDDDLHFFAPEFIFEEFEKRRSLVLAKTDRTESEFEHLLTAPRKRITTISNEETDEFIAHARKISPDLTKTTRITLHWQSNSRAAFGATTRNSKRSRQYLFIPRLN